MTIEYRLGSSLNKLIIKTVPKTLSGFLSVGNKTFDIKVAFKFRFFTFMIHLVPGQSCLPGLPYN